MTGKREKMYTVQKKKKTELSLISKKGRKTLIRDYFILGKNSEQRKYKQKGFFVWFFFLMAEKDFV